MRPINSIILEVTLDGNSWPDNTPGNAIIKRTATYAPSDADNRFECTIVARGRIGKKLGECNPMSRVRIVGRLHNNNTVEAEHIDTSICQS